MNYSFPLYSIFKTLTSNRRLVYVLVQRDILSRYITSTFGALWALINPVLMLLIYTFVFSVVFKTRWGWQDDSKGSFALILYAGLIIFNFFSECIIRAPMLIISNVNLVKKVVFPLEALPIVAIGSALFHLVINFSAWLIFYFFLIGTPSLKLMLFPLVLIPIIFFTLGATFLLASIGVYFRDTNQIIGLLTTLLLFLGPIFYPASAFPAEYQPLLLLNPLTPGIEMTRDILIFDRLPTPLYYFKYFCFSLLSLALGAMWFEKTRIGFSDVL